MSHRSSPLHLLFVPIGLFAFGCHEPAQPTAPTVARIAAQTPEQLEELWESAGDTLRAHYFRLDRQDRNEGVITTYPETSANWFEWWRPQPQPAYYWAEANLHTMQRQATVQIKPAADHGSYDVGVEIERYRYSLEERQIDNSAAALRLFSGGAPTESGQRLSPAESSHWVRLGRDAALEERLLSTLLRRYRSSAAPATQPASEFGQQ